MELILVPWLLLLLRVHIVRDIAFVNCLTTNSKVYKWKTKNFTTAAAIEILDRRTLVTDCLEESKRKGY